MCLVSEYFLANIIGMHIKFEGIKKEGVTMTRFPSKFESPGESPGFLLWQVSNSWQREQKKALAKLDLTHVQFVLLAGVRWLEMENQIVTQIQLSKHAKTDPMMTSQVLRTLEKNGLITRKPHPTDTRSLSLHTTTKGKALVKKGIKVVEEVDESFFSPLDKRLSNFHKLLSDLVN